MFRFLFKSIPSSNRTLHCELYSTSSRKAEKSISLENGKQDSFSVKYLMNQFGFSKQRAVLYSSKYLKFENSDKPNSVIAFFKAQGFTHSQVTKLVAKNPLVLSCNPQSTLLPKIEFFKSKGFSVQDLATTIAFMPMLLVRSLDKFIVPSFNFITDFMGSEKDAILAISKDVRILIQHESHVKKTIQSLVGAGMSKSAVAFLMKTRPSIFVSGKDKLKKSTSLRRVTQDSFVALMNRFGVSLEKAVSASKYLKFESPDKPDSVISFCKTHGFTDPQIRKIVAAYPRVLTSEPQSTLLPKIQFFRSKGFSAQDLATTIAFTPMLLQRSLEKCIVPSFNFITDFLGSENDAVLAILPCAKILLELESAVKPNIEILLGAGMSKSAIACLMKTRPSLFVSGQVKLESVKEVRNMNMDPESCAYGLALWILTVTRKSTFEAFKRWGCSGDDVLRSSKTCPNFMNISKERLNGIMSLFVHEIGWEPSEVVKRYFMFSLSLNKTLIPRWSVYQELLSRGLIKKKVSMSTMFKMKEDLFLRKFVNCYKDEAPMLLKLYIEKQGIK